MASDIRFSLSQLTGRSRSHLVELADPPCFLHWAVVSPFLALRGAARAAGIEMVPVSSFRDFDRQLAIWNGKFRGDRPLLGPDGARLDPATLDDAARVAAILHWSALPGASRHHWGTDFDVIDSAAMPTGYQPRLVPEEYARGGVFARLDAWLGVHAARFGFFRPYTSLRGGVQPEPWHLSHAPVAQQAQAQLSVEMLRDVLKVGGLAGQAVVASQLPCIVARYVRNIDPPPAACLYSRDQARLK